MKRLIIVAIGAGVLAGLGFYSTQPKARSRIPAETAADAPPSSFPEEIQVIEAIPRATEQSPQPVVARISVKPGPPPAAITTISNIDTPFVTHAVDVLVSSTATSEQRRDVWKQLRDAGKLDLAIVELERRMASNPAAAEYSAVLGHAYLQKCGTLKDVREQGILAMQADKLFDTALNLDPNNWEARFTKAVAMSYWPPMLNKGDEVIQHFQLLIAQQEAQPAQPHFAESYSWLGDQYQKAGRTDDARAVWERGASLFPSDEKLRSKLVSIP